MFYDKELVGKYVTLRSAKATEDDAKACIKLRSDKEKTKYMHAVDNTVEQQIDWMKKQIEEPNDYLFLVENKNNEIIGMMGGHGFQNDVANAGRILMYGNAFESFEAYILLIEFGFNVLHLKRWWGDIAENNVSATKFDKMFGWKFPKKIKSPLGNDVWYLDNLSQDEYYSKWLKKPEGCDFLEPYFELIEQMFFIIILEKDDFEKCAEKIKKMIYR